MVITVLAPDHPNPTQYPTPPITSKSNRVQSPSGGGGGPLLADFRSLNDSSSSSDSSSPPPPAAGASPSFLPPLGGVLGENDPGTDFDPDEPFVRPDDPPGLADARRDLRHQAQR